MNQSIQTAVIQLNEKTIRMLDGLYCLNDFHKASGGDRKFQPANFIRLSSTKSLIDEIIKSSDVRITPVESLRGNTSVRGTYVCRELVYAYAMWISPAFHLAVIRFLDQNIASSQAKPNTAIAKDIYIPNNIGRFLVINSGNGVSTIRDASQYHLVSIERMRQIVGHIDHLSYQLSLASQQLASLSIAVTSANEVPPLLCDFANRKEW